MYQVSAVTFLSVLGITDQPVFGLVVTGTIGAITMAWKTNGQIYVMERNVRNYDIRDPLQALQFVSILPRLARHGADLLKLLKKPLAISDVEEWSKLYQRPADEAWLEAEKEKAEARSKEDEKRKREEEASTKADLVATESDAESEEE
ncbi:hypothetical protein P692DRAFT_20722495 [Suillus brevipes Sb2]|nr:hypothetical protein P692DRAFT_20722495 [Suillus brevipes Sb2]